MGKNNKYYAVNKGHTLGIFVDWGACNSAIKRYSGSEFKSFNTLEKAKEYMKKKGIEEYKVYDGSSKKKKKKKRTSNKLSIDDLSKYIIDRLKDNNFKIQYYKSDTGSIYIKMDYGVSNSIRISNHQGLKTLNYRYNLRTDINKFNEKDGINTFLQKFYPVANIDNMIEDIILSKREKIKNYGEDRYEFFMQNNIKNNGHKRGFWSKCVEI